MGHANPWAGGPGLYTKVREACVQVWVSKEICLDSFPDLPQGQTLIQMCKLNKFFFPLSCFWSCVCHNHRMKLIKVPACQAIVPTDTMVVITTPGVIICLDSRPTPQQGIPALMSLNCPKACCQHGYPPQWGSYFCHFSKRTCLFSDSVSFSFGWRNSFLLQIVVTDDSSLIKGLRINDS